LQTSLSRKPEQDTIENLTTGADVL
jgi:hypothetical protein